MLSSVSHKSTNVVESRFTPRNHAPGQIKSQIFWNFWNPSLKNTLFFEQRFRYWYKVCQVDYVHLEADLGYIYSYKNL